MISILNKTRSLHLTFGPLLISSLSLPVSPSAYGQEQVECKIDTSQIMVGGCLSIACPNTLNMDAVEIYLGHELVHPQERSSEQLYAPIIRLPATTVLLLGLRTARLEDLESSTRKAVYPVFEEPAVHVLRIEHDGKEILVTQIIVRSPTPSAKEALDFLYPTIEKGSPGAERGILWLQQLLTLGHHRRQDKATIELLQADVVKLAKHPDWAEIIASIVLRAQVDREIFLQSKARASGGGQRTALQVDSLALKVRYQLDQRPTSSFAKGILEGCDFDLDQQQKLRQRTNRTGEE